MVKDPNCNTYIPLKSAIVGNVKGSLITFAVRSVRRNTVINNTHPGIKLEVEIWIGE